MNTRKPWWWWTALVGAVGTIVALSATSNASPSWKSGGNHWLLIVNRGTLFVVATESSALNARRKRDEARFERRSATVKEAITRHLAEKDEQLVADLVRVASHDGRWLARPEFKRYSRPWGFLRWHVALPLYIPLLALLVVVAWPYLPPIVRRRRRKAGLCVACAYDLTGNESGICPECGTEVRAM